MDSYTKLETKIQKMTQANNEFVTSNAVLRVEVRRLEVEREGNFQVIIYNYYMTSFDT